MNKAIFLLMVFFTQAVFATDLLERFEGVYKINSSLNILKETATLPYDRKESDTYLNAYEHGFYGVEANPVQFIILKKENEILSISFCQKADLEKCVKGNLGLQKEKKCRILIGPFDGKKICQKVESEGHRLIIKRRAGIFSEVVDNIHKEYVFGEVRTWKLQHLENGNIEVIKSLKRKVLKTALGIVPVEYRPFNFQQYSFILEKVNGL